MNNWQEVSSKQVRDSDGFWTDYTWYSDGERHIFIFGDKDIYGPETGSEDRECETEAEAQEWFDNYNGFEEDLDSKIARASAVPENWENYRGAWIYPVSDGMEANLDGFHYDGKSKAEVKAKVDRAIEGGYTKDEKLRTLFSGER